jgi:hypothetical protein
MALDWLNDSLQQFLDAFDVQCPLYNSMEQVMDEHYNHLEWLQDNPDAINVGDVIVVPFGDDIAGYVDEFFEYPLMYGSWLLLIAMAALDSLQIDTVLSEALTTDTLLVGCRRVDNSLHLFFMIEEGLHSKKMGTFVRSLFEAPHNWALASNPKPMLTCDTQAIKLIPEHPFLTLTPIQRSTVSWLQYRLFSRTPIQDMFYELTNKLGQTLWYSPLVHCIVKEVPTDMPCVVALADEAAGKDTALCVYLRMAIDNKNLDTVALYTKANLFDQWIVKLDMLDLLKHVQLCNIEDMRPSDAELVIFDNAQRIVSFSHFATVPKRVIHLWHRMHTVDVNFFLIEDHPFNTFIKETNNTNYFILRHKQASVAPQTISLSMNDTDAYANLRNHYVCRLNQDITQNDSLEALQANARQRVAQLQMLSSGMRLRNPMPLFTGSVSVDDACSICLQEIMCLPVRLSLCQHMFCRSCIGKWLQQSNACPLCRTDFEKMVSVPMNVVVSSNTWTSGTEKIDWIRANLKPRTVIYTQYTPIAMMLRVLFPEVLIWTRNYLSFRDIGTVDLLIMFEPFRNADIVAHLRRVVGLRPEVCQWVTLQLRGTVDDLNLYTSTSSLTNLQEALMYVN